VYLFTDGGSREAEQTAWQVEREALLAQLRAIRVELGRGARTGDNQGVARVQSLRSQLADLDRQLETMSRRGGEERRVDLNALAKERATLQRYADQLLEQQTHEQITAGMRALEAALEAARAAQKLDAQLKVAAEEAARANALVRRDQLNRIEQMSMRERIEEIQTARDSLQRRLAELQAQQERMQAAQRALAEETKALQEQIERLRQEATTPDAPK
jgi:chromosome segregation ATPase